MGRRPLIALVFVAAGLLASCGSSAATVSLGPDEPVTTTEPLRTTLLESAPVTLPPSARPPGVSASAKGYDVAGTDGIWIEPNGDAVVVGCSEGLDPGPMIRANAIPGYRGVWTCT
ncbi:MAG TPA: hypothetical protein VNS19_13845 [Acidimicrobiales bacterium]|nr:hypothetical protein [Acidimicrobiales bacterium]